MSSVFTQNFTQNYLAKMSFPPCFYKHYAISSLEPTNGISKMITCALKFLDSHSSQWQLLSCAHFNTFERHLNYCSCIPWNQTRTAWATVLSLSPMILTQSISCFYIMKKLRFTYIMLSKTLFRQNASLLLNGCQWRKYLHPEWWTL